MRYTAVFLLALVCLNAVCAVSLRKSASTSKTSIAIERLRFIGKKSPMAAQIVSAIQLHLSSGGAVDDVITLVQQADDDVHARRDALNEEFVAKKVALNKIIDSTNESLVSERVDLADANAQIDADNEKLTQLATTIANLQSELEALNTRESQVNEARANDVSTYAIRKVRDENSLAALDQIVQKLQALQARGNAFLQVSKKEIERALSRIPKTNPIQALVQLSSKFDENQLQNVVSKLQSIQVAIQQSYNEDRNGEVSSQEHYDALVSEISRLRKEKTEALNDAVATQAQVNTHLSEQEERRDNLTAQIKLNEALVASTTQELNDDIVSYTQRLSDADDAVNAVDAALRILQQNRDELANREADSDRLNAPVQ